MPNMQDSTRGVRRCVVEPQPLEQTAVLIDGREVTRWHFHPSAPRPCFFPIIGPSGQSLTRMGHPGAPNHDHHRSVWFAHQAVSGVDFWSNRAGSQIRQLQWLAYEDGDGEARLAVRLGWYDGHNPADLLQQDVIAVVRPDEAAPGAWFLELHTELRPHAEMLELGMTNFGLLAVRVAASISEYFGGGRITGANGKTGEPANFAQPNAWVDYSGPVRGGSWEGITYFDHPDNPGFPSRWHVREDGWMGASLCRTEPRLITLAAPLRLRYLLHIHAGPVDPARAADLLADFRRRPRLEVRKATVKHREFVIEPAE